MKRQGRSFDCSKCPTRIQQKRRCREDRWDFTEEDDPIFPIYVTKGSQSFGFCPAKATWDADAVDLFQTLSTCLASHSLLLSGGVTDQPYWFTQIFGWFSQRVSDATFYTRAKAILGDGTSGNKSGRAKG